MNAIEFERPILVVSGIGMPVKISTVTQAHAFLDGWPVSGRNAAHKLAIDACRAALRGDIDGELARSAFKGFARRQEILVEPFDAEIADMPWQPTSAIGAGATVSIGAHAV